MSSMSEIDIAFQEWFKKHTRREYDILKDGYLVQAAFLAGYVERCQDEKNQKENLLKV